MEIEYIGKVLPDGHLSIDEKVLKKLQKGKRLRIKIEQLSESFEPEKRNELDPTAKRILNRMANASQIWIFDDPRELIHSKLTKDRLEEKYQWKE